MNQASIVFFSGGTALRETAAAFARRKIPSLHLITTFDSGGSSALLRKAFGMPAVGDIRSRILSLACKEEEGVADLCALLQHRIGKKASSREAGNEYEALARGTHPLADHKGESIALVRESLQVLAKVLPDDFALAGASIGNLVLCERYLAFGRRLRPAVEFLSSLVRVSGRVEGIAETPAHLAVRLKDGTVISGQHRFTGKEALPVTSPVSELWLCKGEDDPSPVKVAAPEYVLSHIRSASCLCFPMGSFFSSVIANLLPGGVCEAIREADCPKVFIPNPGPDPELLGHGVEEQLAFLLEYLGGEGMVTHLFTDARAYHCGRMNKAFFHRHGVEVVFHDLFPRHTLHSYNGELVVRALNRLSAQY